MSLLERMRWGKTATVVITSLSGNVFAGEFTQIIDSHGHPIALVKDSSEATGKEGADVDDLKVAKNAALVIPWFTIEHVREVTR